MKLERMQGVRYVSIEGLDAVGKDTHTQALSDLLVANGYNTYIAHHGYDTPYGNDIIQAVKESHMSGDSELALLFTMWYLNILMIHRNIETGYRVNKTTHRRCYGTVVIFNRYIDSTYIYQVGMGGASPELFHQYNREILNSFMMDYTVILTALPETVLRRTKARPELTTLDSKEQLSTNHHEVMHELYLSHMQDRKCTFISTELPIAEVQTSILESVLSGLKVAGV